MKIKKLIPIIAAAMAAVFTHTSAADTVSISFKLGDTTLDVNGNKMTVEKPYVTDNGVTMVPVRVISEAFNAEVEWNGQARTVNISSGDKNIWLKIDDKTAYINDTPMSLESAPAISGNGSTMVPLRFISESFGADVSWRPDTNEINVSGDKLLSSQDIQLPAGYTMHGDASFTSGKALGISLALPEEDMEVFSNSANSRVWAAKNRTKKLNAINSKLDRERMACSTYVQLTVYKSSETASAKSIADYEYSIKEYLYDKSINTISDLSETILDGKPAYLFSVSTKGSLHSDGETYYVYVDNGKFVDKIELNSSVGYKLNADTVINSVKITAPSGVAGAEYSFVDYTSPLITADTLKDAEIKYLPELILYINANDDTNRYLYGSVSSIRITADKKDIASGKITSDRRIISSTYNSMIGNNSKTIVSPRGGCTLGGLSYTTAAVLRDDGELSRYLAYYIASNSKYRYTFTVQFGEREDPEVAMGIAERLLSAVKLPTK